jgi:hypothetical protein
VWATRMAYARWHRVPFDYKRHTAEET